MRYSRREFLVASAATVGAGLSVARMLDASPAAPSPRAREQGYDPWLEVDAKALEHNVGAIARLSGGRPILVVAKNNAYGLGLATVGPLLDRLPQVWGFAVVRADEAIALRDAGVRKPVLLMGLCPDAVAVELVARGVRLAPFTDDAVRQLARVARGRSRPVVIHLYVDTGMGRMGMPYHRALPWIESLAALKHVRIEGTLTELTEDVDFDREQVARCRTLLATAREKGVNLGRLHAASSAAVMHLPEAHLDMVRPGLAVYGGYVSEEAMARGELRPTYRLRARVVRVEQLRAGDGVSYHRRYVAPKPTWVAVLPVGHVDGYPSGAVGGCEVLIGGRLYRVIGTVSASHTVIELGDERTVEIGEIATLVGPDHPAIHPNTVAKRASWSEYNMFMHLGPTLPRRVVG